MKIHENEIIVENEESDNSDDSQFNELFDSQSDTESDTEWENISVDLSDSEDSSDNGIYENNNNNNNKNKEITKTKIIKINQGKGIIISQIKMGKKSNKK